MYRGARDDVAEEIEAKVVHEWDIGGLGIYSVLEHACRKFDQISYMVSQNRRTKKKSTYHVHQDISNHEHASCVLCPNILQHLEKCCVLDAAACRVSPRNPKRWHNLVLGHNL